MKRTYYHTCPLCGANLDPGESCDCQNGNDHAESNVTEKSDPMIYREENIPCQNMKK